MSDVLETAYESRVLHLRLNRPEKRNALSSELCRALVSALSQANGDPLVGAILLSGNGKSFCAGMDLDEAAGGTTAALADLHEQLFTIGARLSKPLVAAVRGAALGGGAGLVANCAIVIAAENAAFGLTEIRLGLWPFLVFRAVSAALGERRTVELALTGRTFGSGEALQMGLIHQVAPEAVLEERAVEVAQALAAFSPSAIQAGLRFVQEARGKSWGAAGEVARRVREQVFESPDFQEGIRAFREKRPPQWPSIR